MEVSSRGSGSTSDRITQVAIRLFGINGYAATSLRDIASEVGVEVASLYNHFPAKEDILWRIVKEAIFDLDTMHDVPRNGSSSADLKDFVRRHVAYHAENPYKARVVNTTMRSLSPSRFDEVRDFRRRYGTYLQSILITGMDRDEFRISSIQLSSYAILQMGMAVSDWYRADGPLNVQDLCDFYVEIVLRMVCAPDSEAS